MRKFAVKLSYFSLVLLLTLLSTIAMAQMATIKGTVKNSKENLEGASILLEGNGVGTHTNTIGGFELKVKAGSYNVTVSYVGHQKKTISVTVTEGQVYKLDVELSKDKDLQQVTVVGSRSAVIRSNTQTVAPVDVFSAKELALTGQVEPTQMINFVAPSFNSSRQTIADGTDHIDPATLRGLGPDQVLVLVNGIRRHNTALTNLNGTIGRGSVGTDMNAIPTSAIEKIEILRDGAASQYGSDAIGGVINIVLKKDVKRTNVNVHVGQQYLGDGLTKTISANHAFKLGTNGFADIFADIRLREATNRVGEYTGTVYTTNVALDNQLIAERRFDRGGNLLLGNSQSNNYNFGANFGFPVTDKIKFTGSILTGYRKGDAAGFYRYPKQTTQVILELYPDGFLPHILTDVRDRSYAGKLNGSIKDWNWELATVYGQNGINFNVTNSNNASQFALGRNAPTSFYAGKLLFEQNTTNLNFTKDFSKKFKVKSFNLNLGAEARLEKYTIGAGEDASWKNYDPASGRAGGAQVFPGYQPGSAGDKGRYILSVYSDVEVDVNEKLMYNIAARYEDYSDFGNNIAAKGSARYKVNDALTVRATVSNGFRAPSLHQRFYSSISTLFQSINGQTVATQNLVAKNGSALANAFGIPTLTAEKSMQYSLGITSKPFKGKNISITVDAYQIDIKDRIVLTGTFTKASSPLVATLLAAYPEVNSVSFFTNAINTKTQGLDIVINSGSIKAGSGILEATLAYNQNQTTVEQVKSTPVLAADPNLANGTLFNRLEKGRFEWAQPRNKATLGLTYRIGKLTLMSRVSRFGEIKTLDPSNPALDESFSPKAIVDASISYRPIYWMNITMGANNIADTYPDKIQNFANTSDNRLIYSRAATQFGFNGGYWYTNLAFDLTNIKAKPKPLPAPVAPVTPVAPKPVDTDDDGVIDENDKCPTVVGLKSLGGCPDTDGDGVADQEDKCPTVAGIKLFNGCPDTDGDGIEDAKDKCPSKVGIAKYEGCPIPDTDGDGLNDEFDKCPTIAGSMANNGCPEEPKKEQQKKLDNIAKTILFNTQSAVIQESSFASLDEVVAILNSDANFHLEIEGHSDNVGNEAFNTKLSGQRAQAVKIYLEKKGIAPLRIAAQGFGSSKPIADNATAEGRTQNRRVVLTLK